MTAKLSLFLLLLTFIACVPAKKYNELLEREKLCTEELAKFKKSSRTKDWPHFRHLLERHFRGEYWTSFPNWIGTEIC